MGAWGTDIFENDAACDWAYALEAVHDLSLVQSALEAVEGGGEELLDADAACEALAACEVLARLKGNFGGHDSSTEAVDAWVMAHPQGPSEALIQRAMRVIDQVIGEKSELRQLWDEAGREEWIATVEHLRKRLS